MALYTSYYTRQLALRAEAGAPGDLQQEGEKTVQKTVARRTVDLTGPYVEWMQVGGCLGCTALRLHRWGLAARRVLLRQPGRRPAGRCRRSPRGSVTPAAAHALPAPPSAAPLHDPQPR